MSNELAISAVTLALRNFLQGSVTFDDDSKAALGITGDVQISVLPPHRVRKQFPVQNVVNLFLYRTDANAAWRNKALPSSTRAGENGLPPLALDLEYLVSAYGEDDHEEVAHFMLAQAMRALHDNAILARKRLELALELAHVHDQLESIKITPRSLSVDEISKLWTVFHSDYRISAAYLATVVLIESRAPVRSALPVLTRGKDDRGIDAVAGMPPSLDNVQPATGFNAAVIGEDLVVNGERLDASGIVARVRHPLMPGPVDLPVTPVHASQLKVTIPPAPPFMPPELGAAAAWPAGIYSLSLVVTRPDSPSWMTNDVTFALAPVITVSPSTHHLPPANVEVTITATPQVRDGQPVLVIWDGTQLTPKSVSTVPDDDANAQTTVTFEVESTVGIHRVRLRVGGVDSILMKRTGGVLAFDDAQSVQVVSP